MSDHYTSDNECILNGSLWALIIAVVIGALSLVFVDFGPTAIVISVVALLIGLIIAFFMCKSRTVARGGVDMRAVDLARAEMGIAAPAAAAVDKGAESDAAEKANGEAEALTAAEAQAKAEAAAEAQAKAEAEAEAQAKAEAEAEAQAKAEAEAEAQAKAEAAENAAAKAEQAAEAHDHAEEVGEGEAKPALLTEARGGQADDLKKIKGVGPKLEKELNEAGVFHFDQIASWTKEEIYWADHHLVSFKGRVSRDNWVDQAKELAK